MKITVTPAAAKSGALRVWLRRIPEASGTIVAFRLGEDGQPTEEVSRTDVYGRGEGSSATQRCMLLFRFRPGDDQPPLEAGESLELRVADPKSDGYRPAELDITEII